MKKFLLLLVISLLLASCGPSVDELKQGIIETETNGLPMTIQKMEGVISISIDSMVIVNNVDPYYGYLVTSWDVNEKHVNSYEEHRRTNEYYSYKRVQKRMNVEVRDIHVKGRKYEWRTDWGSAYLQAIEDNSFTEDTYGGIPAIDDIDDPDISGIIDDCISE